MRKYLKPKFTTDPVQIAMLPPHPPAEPYGIALSPTEVVLTVRDNSVWTGTREFRIPRGILNTLMNWYNSEFVVVVPDPKPEWPKKFELKDYSHNHMKFWEVEPTDRGVKITFGRIGSLGTEILKKTINKYQAEAKANTLIKEKERKGYKRV